MKRRRLIFDILSILFLDFTFLPPQISLYFLMFFYMVFRIRKKNKKHETTKNKQKQKQKPQKQI